MPVRTIKVPPPIGGVNRALARSQQPDSPLPSCWDALNVVPYDRYGRLRVSQRSGTEPVWASAIGGGTHNVQLLYQVTRVGTPSTPTTFYTDPFTYGNGNLTGNGNWGAVGGFTSWVVDTNNLRGLTGVADFGNLQTTGMVGFNEAATFAVSANFQFTTGTSLHNKNLRIELQDASVVAAWFVDITETAAGIADIELQGPDDSVTVTGVTVTRDTTHTIEFIFDVSAQTGTLLLDGTTLGSFTTSNWGAALTRLFIAAINSGGLTSSGATILESITITTGSVMDTPRQTYIIAVSGGNIYQGTLTVQGALTTGGSGALNSSNTVLPSAAAIFGKVYFVDGSSTLKVLDVATATTTTWASTAGTETATTLGKYTIAALYRGRLVLAHTFTDPQNFVCSRVGVPTDFDYSQDDPAAAFAGNASENGRIGEPITALMPFSDDMMGIGGDHNLWIMRGDPAADGAIDNISDQIGVLGKDAWCRAPNGLVYFVGTGGFYRWDAQSRPESIADTKFNQFFANIDRTANIVQCVWDRDRRGCFIFVTSVETGESTHIWYDERTGGTYWPMQYPNSFGPISSIVYDGDGPDDRKIILGTRDGKLLQWQDNSRTDNDNGVGTAISAYVVLGPIHPADDAAKLVGTTFQFGELSTEDFSTPGRWQCDVVLAAGPTAYDVTEGTPFQTATIQVGLDRRTKTFRQRLRGAWFSITVSNSATAQYFVLDDLLLEFDVAGKERRQR